MCEHLGDEGGHRLQPVLRDEGVHRLEELHVVGLGQLDPREEVGGDAAEERHVLRAEGAGCSPTPCRLQPHALQAAALRRAGCDPKHGSLRAYAVTCERNLGRLTSVMLRSMRMLSSASGLIRLRLPAAVSTDLTARMP